MIFIWGVFCCAFSCMLYDNNKSFRGVVVREIALDIEVGKTFVDYSSCQNNVPLQRLYAASGLPSESIWGHLIQRSRRSGA